MARKYLTAGLLLVLTLSLTACGTSDKAGTSAHRWDGGTNAASQDWAIQRQADARGPLPAAPRSRPLRCCACSTWPRCAI